jgi:hypothetical protein
VVGQNALQINTSGVSNCAFGYNALTLNTTGYANCAFGHQALASNTTSESNNAFGYDALATNTTGIYNNGVGRAAIKFNTTGSSNNAVGQAALRNNTEGSSNSAIGSQAGFNNVLAACSYNTFLGAATDLDANTNAWTKSTAIGYNAKIIASNQIVLGTSTEKVFMPGNSIYAVQWNSPATINSVTIPQYGLSWQADTTFNASPCGFLSGWGGLQFITSGTTKMVIKADGNVGVGTNAPLAKLQVTDSTGGSILISPPDATSLGLKSSLLFAGTFGSSTGTGDTGARYTAQIVSGFIPTAAWGGEYLAFNVGSNDANDARNYSIERMRITGSGNVGIGTTNPSYKLDVAGVINSNAGGVSFTANNASYNSVGTTSAYPTTRFNTIAAGDGVNAIMNGSGGNYVAGQGLTLTGQSLFWAGGYNSYASQIQIDGGRSALAGVNHGQIRFYTANTQQMTIHESGNVGIGVANPTGSTVQIGSAGILRLGPTGNAGNSVAFGLETSRYQIAFSTYRDVVQDQIGAKIAAINYNTWQNNSPAVQSTALAFFVNSNSARLDGNYPTFSGTNTSGTTYDSSTEAMRIAPSGNVGIGTTNPQAKLDIVGSTQLTNTSTGSFNNFYGKVPPSSTYPSTVKPNTTSATSSTWTNNGVTWSVSASNYSGTAYPYLAFDANNTTNNKWAVNSAYSSSTGAYTGTTFPITPVGQSSIQGEWLQIQSNVPVIMNSYNIGCSDVAARSPKTFYICGSNDTTTWYLIQSATIATNPYTVNTSLGSLFTVTGASPQNGFTTNNTYGNTGNAYTYFRMVVTSTFISDTLLAVGDWTINFTLGTVVGPSRTLLYMDSTNINQLDVSGSLAFVNSNSSITVSPNTTAANSSMWSTNNVTWITSASSYLTGSTNYFPYLAFDTNISANRGWLSAANSYNATTGAYAGSTAAITPTTQSAIQGEWLQLQSSVPVVMKSYNIGAIDIPLSNPRTFWILGSNDGTSWNPIHYATTTATSGVYPNFTYIGNFNVTSGTAVNGFTTVTTFPSYSSLSYTYFRIVVISTFPNVGNTYTYIGEWAPVFAPASSAVSLALDNAVLNQLNIGGSLGIAGGVAVSGYVGIGTTSPACPLDVRGSVLTNNQTCTARFTNSNNNGQLLLCPGIYQGSSNDANCTTYEIPGTGVHYFWDNVLISGTMSAAGTKAFNISHPLDPSNTRLIHASVEAPRHDLIYSGTVSLINGVAIVNIDRDSCPNHPMRDGTFEALTRDVRIYLQNNETFDRVKGNITGGTLNIECENNASSASIDWMVIADRKDDILKNSKFGDENGYLITERNTDEELYLSDDYRVAGSFGK